MMADQPRLYKTYQQRSQPARARRARAWRASPRSAQRRTRTAPPPAGWPGSPSSTSTCTPRSGPAGEVRGAGPWPPGRPGSSTPGTTTCARRCDPSAGRTLPGSAGAGRSRTPWRRPRAGPWQQPGAGRRWLPGLQSAQWSRVNRAARVRAGQNAVGERPAGDTNDLVRDRSVQSRRSWLTLAQPGSNTPARAAWRQSRRSGHRHFSPAGKATLAP
jgi:hypothetical protein